MSMEHVERALTEEDRNAIRTALAELPPVLGPKESYRRQWSLTLWGVVLAIGSGLFVAWTQREAISADEAQLLALAIAALLSLLIGLGARLWRGGALATWRAIEEARAEAEAIFARGTARVWRGVASVGVACEGYEGPGYLVQTGAQELLFLLHEPHTSFELASWPLLSYRPTGTPLPVVSPVEPEVIDANEGDWFALSLAAFLADPSLLAARYQGNRGEDTVP